MASFYEMDVAHILMTQPMKWYDGYKDVRIKFEYQATCRYKNGGHGRVDLSAHVYMPGKGHGGSWYNFEIKSSKSDLYSNKGLNLFNMYNYMVYPRSVLPSMPGAITYEMIEQRLKEIGCEHAGIICIINDHDYIVERKAKRYYGDGMPPEVKEHNFGNR